MWVLIGIGVVVAAVGALFGKDLKRYLKMRNM
jgi:hypothetical protein